MAGDALYTVARRFPMKGYTLLIGNLSRFYVLSTKRPFISKSLQTKFTATTMLLLLLLLLLFG